MTHTHAQAKFDGDPPFFFRSIRKHERMLYIAVASILFVLLTIQIVRQPSSSVLAGDGNDYDLNAKYVQGNHAIQIYSSPNETALYTAPDFGNMYDSKDGYLSQGTLFIIDDAGDGIQTAINPNEPHDNESIYNFKRIYILRDGDLKKRYVIDYAKHYDGDELVATNLGLYGRYDTLVGFVYDNVQRAGYDDSSPYQYAGNGLYSITAQADTRLYNTAGKQIDTLSAGSKVFAGFDSEFATGFNHPTLLRITGFKSEGGIEQYGTFFVDIFAGNDEVEYAIITE